MRNKALVRIQMLLLVVLVGLVVWRMSGGGTSVKGFVTFSSMDTRRLYEKTFSTERTGIIHLRAVGAFENDQAGSELAVYPWVIDRTRNEVIWLPEKTKAVRDGVLAEFDETFQIQPGVYTVYFTTYGPNPQSRSEQSFLGLKPHWTNYEEFWSLSLNDDSDTGEYRIAGRSAAEEARKEHVFWSSAPMRNRSSEHVIVRTATPTVIYVQATAEVCTSGCDIARIISVPDDDVVWEMSMANTEVAGGWEANRMFEDSVPLPAGVFRAEMSTDGTHASGSWRANPPWFPDSWGLTLSSLENSDALTIVDPWSDSEPIIRMTRVGSGENKRIRVRVAKTVKVVVSALGEIGTGGSSLYDFGRVERDSDGAIVWEMSRKGSEPAGGDTYNRKETAFLTLEPDVYTFSFQTDNSHAFDDWNKGRPEFPERWGMAVFPLDVGSFDASSIEILSNSDEWAQEVEVGNNTPGSFGTPIVSMTGLGNEEEVEDDFTLEEESDIRIVALGEISTSGRYDYGWIEQSGSGERVWEMTMQNTAHAGGDDRNRRFDRVITLPAGTYTVHFETDFGWARGDFGAGRPDRPGEWGISIFEAN